MGRKMGKKFASASPTRVVLPMMPRGCRGNQFKATGVASKALKMHSSRMKISDGDWVCADESCGNVNFARRTSCNRCGKAKVKSKVDTLKLSGMRVGKQAANKSGGLFSEEDWICSKCGNVNWARRSQCNMCNNQKFAKVEARTGYGGGYNERGTVEYKERVPSDDEEYDQFGRKKKKRGANSQDEKKEEKAAEVEEEEEEEEEDGDLSKYDLAEDEDDDDDDVDLSKYALDASDDNDESNTSKKKGRSRSRSSSRSRSRSPKKRRRSLSSSGSSRSRSRSHSRSRSTSSSRSRSRSRSSRSSSRSRSRSRSNKRSRSQSYSRSPDNRRKHSRSK